MANYDLEEELERIKREFDQKFGNSGMTFDELPDDLEGMLSSYGYGDQQKNAYAHQPMQQATYQPQNTYANNNQYKQQYQQQYQQPQQQQQYYEEEQYEDDQYYDNNQQQGNPAYDQQISIDLEAYLDEQEGLEDEEVEFDDALPPLEDMLLLINNPKIHEAYNYVPPKRLPAQKPVLTMNQPVQAPVQHQVQVPTGGYPSLDQPAWNVRDCDAIVQQLKKLLMSILQELIGLDALTVKKLDLQNPVNAEKAENIFRSAGNQLKEVREIVQVVAHIDTQDGNHTDIQLQVESQSDITIKSTVVMLRTAMNVTKKLATINQFGDAYTPFFDNAKRLIGLVNKLQFGTWGPNEVFFLA